MKQPFVSIVIPVEEFNDFLAESLPKYQNINYFPFEVLVFTTYKCEKKFPNVRFIAVPNLKGNPARKRDLALKYAKGDWFAFIDDDAYPSKNWLKNASKYFSDETISAVCGPGVTPKDASLLESASGLITASKLGGGSYTYRFIPDKKRFVDDYPSMNLIIRRSDFKKVGGFDSNFYPGEDTKLCLDLTYKLGKKIAYDPNVLVYHHRRPLFKPYLKQVGNYGLHRGYFARVLPKTSRKLVYFIPSIFTLGLVFAPFLWRVLKLLNFKFWSSLYFLYFAVLSFYFFLLILEAVSVFLRERSLKLSILVAGGIFLTHIWYGVRFIQGFLIRKLRK